jgi:hypothetical protein
MMNPIDLSPSIAYLRRLVNGTDFEQEEKTSDKGENESQHQTFPPSSESETQSLPEDIQLLIQRELDAQDHLHKTTTFKSG